MRAWIELTRPLAEAIVHADVLAAACFEGLGQAPGHKGTTASEAWLALVAYAERLLDGPTAIEGCPMIIEVVSQHLALDISIWHIEGWQGSEGLVNFKRYTGRIEIHWFGRKPSLVAFRGGTVQDCTRETIEDMIEALGDPALITEPREV